MQTTTHDIAEARRAIDGTKGKIARVTFVKRSTGEERTIRARTGVKRDVKGVGQNYDPLTRGLFTVFDMDAENRQDPTKRGQHKNIPLDGITEIICGDLIYRPKREGDES